jgi:hypothetical protein
VEVDQATPPPDDGLPPGATVVWDSRTAPATMLNSTPPAAASSTPTPERAAALASNLRPVGVPARGRGTALDAAKVTDAMAKTYDVGTTPLVDTGYPVVDQFTSPIGALVAAGGVGAVIRAGVSGGLSAALGETFAQAAPQIKYAIVYEGLQAAHVPRAVAVPVALWLSNFKGKGAPTAAEKVVAPPPVRWPQGEPPPTPVAPPPIRYPAAAAEPTPTVVPPPPIRYPAAAAEPTPTVVPPPPIRYSAQAAAPTPVPPPPIRMPAGEPVVRQAIVPPPPIRMPPTEAPVAPRVVPPPPIRMPNTPADFAASAPVATPAAAATGKAATSGKVAPVNVSNAQIKDAGVRYLMKEAEDTVTEVVAQRIVNTAIKNGVRFGDLLTYLQQNY